MAAKAAIAVTTLAFLLTTAGAVGRDTATASALFSQETRTLTIPLLSPHPVNTSYVTYSIRACPVTLVAAAEDTAAPTTTEDGNTATVTTITSPMEKVRAAGCSSLDSNTVPCPDGDAAFCLLIEGVILWSHQKVVCSQPWNPATCREQSVPGTAPYFAYVSWAQEVSFSVTPITASIIGSLQATDRLLLGSAAGVAYDMFVAMLPELDKDTKRVITVYFVPHGGDETFTGASTDNDAAQAHVIFRTEDLSQVWNTAVDSDDGTFYTVVVIPHEFPCEVGYYATTQVTLSTGEAESYVFTEALDAPSGCEDHEKVPVQIDFDVSDTNVELAMTGRDADVIKPITLTWAASNQNTAAPLWFTLKTVHLRITSVVNGDVSVVTEFFNSETGGAAYSDPQHPLFEVMKMGCTEPIKVASCSINVTWSLEALVALGSNHAAQVAGELAVGITAYSEGPADAPAARARSVAAISTSASVTGDTVAIPFTVTHENTEPVFEYSVPSTETEASLEVVREAVADDIGVPVDDVLVSEVIESDLGVDTVELVVVTDGEDSVAEVNATNVQNKAANAGVTIDTNLVNNGGFHANTVGVDTVGVNDEDDETGTGTGGPELNTGMVLASVAVAAMALALTVVHRRRISKAAAKATTMVPCYNICGVGGDAA